MKLNIGKKLTLAFGIILSVFLLSSLLNYLMINDTIAIEKRVTKTRVQTVLLGKNIEIGIQSSLAALRGYMILGEAPKKAEQMKAARIQAWNTIDDALASFKVASQSWTEEKNTLRLKELINTLAEFKAAQQEVEEISHSGNNIPSYQMLLKDAAPKATQMLSDLNNIINEEEKLPATKERKQLLKELADTRGSFAIALANIRAYLLSGDDAFSNLYEKKWAINQQRFEQIEQKQSLLTQQQIENWQNYRSIRKEFSLLPTKMFALRASASWNQANFLLGSKAAPKAQQALAILASMRKSQDKLLAEDIGLLDSNNAFIQTNIIIILIISLITGLTCAFLITRNILSRLNPVVLRAEEIANNNMAGAPLVEKGSDELTQLTSSVNQMTLVLNNLVRNTANSMNDVAYGANDIEEANGGMAKEISNTTDQVSQISAAIEELSASTKDVATNCVDAADNAQSASELALSGGNLAKGTVAKMEEIKAAFMTSSANISSLNAKSQEIESIVGVIKGIADQTNLLALNAAIEAARAGEQGRGFAVVADEVRELAHRTTEATTEVESAILAINSETESAVRMIEQGADKVQEGFEMTNNTQLALADIISSAQGVAAKIQTIATTAEQQSIVTEDVAKNTDTILLSTESLHADSCNVVSLVQRVNHDATEKAVQLRAMV